MVASKLSRKKVQSISHGRPPLHKTTKQLSSKTTRNIIRTHHHLSKLQAQAASRNDEVLAESVMQQIAENGGLSQYQLASKVGQKAERGGDSSKILVEWMKPIISSLVDTPKQLRLLEVGALSVKNACSKVPAFCVERIDLHSQEAGIVNQDFMEMPVPAEQTGKFHIICLSLVLNFVPDPGARGDMIRRLPKFLSPHPSFPDVLPCVFLVLPAPCVLNSRYMTENHLKSIMASVGLQCMKWKQTPKLIYSLWRQDGEGDLAQYKKDQLRSGGKRNNFAIVLR